MISLFVGESFEGTEIRCHEDFLPALQRLGEYAKRCDVRFHVNSSLRDPGEPVKGAIVEPATLSNHHVGHAIDANPVIGGVLIHSSRLRGPYRALPLAFAELVDLVRLDPTLRWGGDFKTEPDPVHFDDNLKRRDTNGWSLKLAEIWPAKETV